MSLSSLPSIIAKIPLPLFGSAAVAASTGLSKAKKLPQFAPWILPAVAGAAWFIWPAIDDETKIAWGIKSDPTAASNPPPAATISVKDLDSSAKKAIEHAYLHHGDSPYTGPAPVTVDPIIRAKRAHGDFSDLQKDWDSFHREALSYNEEDDGKHIS
jgi:hypothetical protein